ncbi:MAG: RHS repeat-associated core domain-containing protein [Nitrospirae bacterium]|nr:RHS repeat-associated core domain-containing protein [Nitrospirota bacterium]
MSYAGKTQTLNYDNDGLLITAGNFTIARNTANGLPESITDGTLTNTRVFSGYGELDGYSYKVNSNGVYTVLMTRDSAGRITQKTEAIGAETNIYDYTYDTLGRLTEVKKNGIISEHYTYDADGNRMTDGRRSYVYSAEDHLITAGTDNYQYNADGFLLSKTTSMGTTTYNYLTRGELLDALLPSGTSISYDHDATGRRIAKRVNGSITEKYLWQDAITLLAVYDSNDNLKTRFNYADDRMPVSMTQNGQTYYLAYDQVGSLRVVTDASGNAVKKIDYDSFGNIINDTNPQMSIPLGFAGGLHDRDTNLVRFGARDYDPAIGRWTVKDPIDFRGGLNVFNYVEADPVNGIDPWGLAGVGFIFPGGSIEGGLVAVGAGATGSAGGGVFWGGPQGTNVGGFASFGAFAGGPNYGHSYPSGNSSNVAGGAFAGGGGGFFITNATCANQLSGPFDTYSFNIGVGPFKVSVQVGVSNGTWIGSATFGPGIGISGSGYQTNTWTTK